MAFQNYKPKIVGMDKPMFKIVYRQAGIPTTSETK